MIRKTIITLAVSTLLVGCTAGSKPESGPKRSGRASITGNARVDKRCPPTAHCVSAVYKEPTVVAAFEYTDKGKPGSDVDWAEWAEHRKPVVSVKAETNGDFAMKVSPGRYVVLVKGGFYSWSTGTDLPGREVIEAEAGKEIKINMSVPAG